MSWLLGILGWIWVALGVWWFFRPQGIRKRFHHGFRKKLRAILILVLFAVAGILFGAGREMGGVAGFVVPAIGVIACVKGLLLLRGKISDPVLDWWGEQSDWFYRGAAVVLVAMGLLLEWFTSRGSDGAG